MIPDRPGIWSCDEDGRIEVEVYPLDPVGGTLCFWSLDAGWCADTSLAWVDDEWLGHVPVAFYSDQWEFVREAD